jgi:hypothetical protein
MSLPVCVITGCITGYVLDELNPDILIPVVAGIVFLPILIVGAYGLRRGYSPGHWWNHIYRGRMAQLTNLLAIVSYIIIMLLVLAREP